MSGLKRPPVDFDDGFEEGVVDAVVGQLGFLTVEADFGKGTGFVERANAEEAFEGSDANAAAIGAGRDAADVRGGGGNRRDR